MNIYFTVKRIAESIRLFVLRLRINNVENISHELFARDIKKIKYLPIDRFFIKGYVKSILECNSVDFITFNFRWFPEGYVHRLMVCLPEVFSDLNFDKTVSIIKNLEHPKLIIPFLNFLQVYCPGVNIHDLVSSSNLSKKNNAEIFQYYSKSGYIMPVEAGKSLITKDNVGIDLIDFHLAVCNIFSK